VSSPSEAHQGQIDYELVNEQMEIVGFFSKEHKAIFTHHDSYVHMHLITKNREIMGHLDEILFKVGSLTLYLPLE
jgi:acetolactate decarboxylase